MRADDEASLATRPAKDHRLTPTLLTGRWRAEAEAVDLAVGQGLDRRVCWREPALPDLTYEEIVRCLIDEDIGVCAHSPRFDEPDVIEHIAGLSSGRLTVEEIRDVTKRFLHSDAVVRLTPSQSSSGWQVARWSTAVHRALEDETLALLDRLQIRSGSAIPTTVPAAGLGVDQQRAVQVVCGEGAAVRAVLAPAGHGKTAMVHAAARAAVADGRPVVAVATAARAVAELSEAGLAAVTVARFRLDLDDQSLAPGSVVVLDEVSQSSTRDVHTILAAVAACPGGQLWVLGDPRQAPSVKAGGIAAELETRVAAGMIPAATLIVNRRQVDPVDRDALALLRGGDSAGSQQVRVCQGWEHEAATPAATRAAMAEAVVSDILDHGADASVALVVSHGQAEDIADHIRRRLTAAGVLTGPTLTGPGWTTDRRYQAGDRVLFHTRCGDRRSPLVNGTAATVTAVDDHGLALHTDGGTAVVIPVEFVRGVGADGTPNLSHAWARTVDGAQGGTWDHAHLLGSAALDAYRGYTGQSRSRHPTHTWNTTPVDDGDHGGRLADQRSAQQQVVAALARVPDTTMAAIDDPWTIDRHLRAVIDAHHAVLEGQPPLRSREITDARRAVTVAHAHLDVAVRTASSTGAAIDNLRPLRAVSRSGRAERRQLQDRLPVEQQAVIYTAGVLARAEHHLQQLEREQRRHDQFDANEGWRRDAIVASVDRLDDHWTAVALACCRADHPLAFGVEPLRLAHHRLTDQLANLDTCLPADRALEQRGARSRLVDAVAERRAAERKLADATQQHDHLSRQRWPRRDSQAIGGAADRVDQARHRLDRAHATETESGARLDRLDANQRQRREALTASALERRALVVNLSWVDTSLERTRPERVLEALHQPVSWQVELLGPVPRTLAGRAVWCAAAHRLETHLDHDTGVEQIWREVCDDVADTPELCNLADRYLHVDRLGGPQQWARAAERAGELHLTHRAPVPHELGDRGFGLDLGL
jgi:hypothetical protein